MVALKTHRNRRTKGETTSCRFPSATGTVEAYEAGKIKRAMGAAFASVGTVLDDEEADRLIARIERAMASAEQSEGGSVSVEDVQGLVERASWKRTITRS